MKKVCLCFADAMELELELEQSKAGAWIGSSEPLPRNAIVNSSLPEALLLIIVAPEFRFPFSDQRFWPHVEYLKSMPAARQLSIHTR